MANDPTIPIPDRDSAPYWAALAEGRLEIQHCADCGPGAGRPGRSARTATTSTWSCRCRAPARCTAWVVPHRPFVPRLKDLVPFAIVTVRPDEEPDILIRAASSASRRPTQGMQVRAAPSS